MSNFASNWKILNDVQDSELENKSFLKARICVKPKRKVEYSLWRYTGPECSLQEHPGSPFYIITIFVCVFNCKPCSTPTSPSHHLCKIACSSLADPTAKSCSLSPLPQLNKPWFWFYCRHCLSIMQNTTDLHYTAAKHILCYLKDSLNHCIFFQPGSLESTSIQWCWKGWTHQTINLLLATVFFLALSQSPGSPRSRQLYNNPPLRVSIDP